MLVPEKTGGVILTTGQEYGMDAFYPDYVTTQVVFQCACAASLASVCVCKTKVGGAWNFESNMCSCLYYTQIIVKLAYSGSGICAELYLVQLIPMEEYRIGVQLFLLWAKGGGS